jgi:hypothetical protein
MAIPPFLPERKIEYFLEASISRAKTCGKLRECLENQGFWMWKTSGVFFHSFHIGTEQKSFEHL